MRTDEVEARLKRALEVVLWLRAVSALSDGCCRLVCEMLDVPTLVSLMEVRLSLKSLKPTRWSFFVYGIYCCNWC